MCIHVEKSAYVTFFNKDDDDDDQLDKWMNYTHIYKARDSVYLYLYVLSFVYDVEAKKVEEIRKVK